MATPVRLTNSLFVAQSDYFMTNSGAWISAGEAVLVDPCMRPDEIDALGQFVAGQGAVPRWLVLTHSHWDHILGPERFPGVPVFAQRRYREVVAQDEAAILAEITRWEASFGRQRGPNEAFAIPLPAETFDQTLTLAVGQVTLHALHVPGHAPDQLALYEPVEACLWASDILSDVEIPFVSDSLAAYERTLERLSGYEVRVLVPGHGHPSTDPSEFAARLAADRAYLAELRARVMRAVETGRSVEETVALCDDMVYRRPAENAFNHRLNVESAYLELGGQADPRRVGYKQDGSLQKESE
jgi:glyoxylase-like metal-dependent hydrolase (beta-lactamase superfamily II)